MTRHPLRLLSLLLLILAALTLSTCISAEERDYIQYDPAKDEFHMLMVLSDIRATDQNGLDYLVGIYRNRDHLIAPIIPGSANAFPLAGFSLLRLSNNTFAPLNIFSSPPATLEIIPTTVHLDSIQITPGDFFLQNKTLGYYQSITVPGKAIDAALEEITTALLATNGPKDSIEAEITRRAAGGKIIPWAQIQTEALKTVTLDPPATAPASQPTQPDATPLTALDNQSLANLKQALADKTLHIKRNHQSITLSLPLSPADSAAFTDLVNQSTARMDELLKTAKPPANDEAKKTIEQMKTVRAVISAFTITSDPHSLTFSLDLLTSARALNALASQRIDMNNTPPVIAAAGDAPANPPALPPDVIQYLRDQKIPLDETLTLDQIVKDFHAHTLKSHPPEKPLPPGEGIAPTTQP